MVTIVSSQVVHFTSSHRLRLGMYSRQTSVKRYEYVTSEEFCDDITVSDLIGHDEEKAKEKKMKKKETFVVFLLISMLVILLLCIVWLVYSSTRSSSSLSGYEDVSCASSDVRCLSLLCPDGARWSQDGQECLPTAIPLLDSKFLKNCKKIAL